MKKLETLAFCHQNETIKFRLAIFQVGLLKPRILNVKYTPLHRVIVAIKLNEFVFYKNKVFLFEVSLIILLNLFCCRRWGALNSDDVHRVVHVVELQRLLH